MKQTHKQTKRSPSHALFWSMLKEMPEYNERYKEVIKEGIVHQYSGGRTSSLSEMYLHHPAEYSKMIEEMKGSQEQRRKRYDTERDLAAKRVIAAISEWLFKTGYTFKDGRHKLAYIKGVACRAANCSGFNKIPMSKLSAIYNLYRKKNEVNTDRSPELNHPICKN